MPVRTRRRLVAALVLAGLLAAPPATRGQQQSLQVVVSFPPDQTVVTRGEVSVEGYVVTSDEVDLEIVVNDGRPQRASVKDTVFVEEVSLDEGRNLIRVGSEERRVWYATQRSPAPAGYRAAYGHIGLGEGCLECHRVTAPGMFALAGEREEICGWCHGDVARGTRAAPWVSTHAPVRAGRCLECHAPHVSGKRGLPAEKPATCASCHPGIEERLKTDRFVHGPMNLGDCRLCHAVHGSPQPKLLVRPATVLCTDCHSDVLGRPGDPALKPHPMVPEGQCGRCHEPHSSPNQRMLRQPAGRLCQGCHEGMTRSFHESKGFSIYVCSKCHDLHRPTQPRLIVDASRSLCTECHDYRGASAFTHSFVAEGRCFICHTFHDAPLPGDVATTCLGCHRDNPRLPAAHGGIAIERARCTSCHEPHQSQRPHLLRGVEHTPFKQRQCARCHPDRTGKTVPAPPALCVACHGNLDLAALPEKPSRVHPPFRERACNDCHRSHNAEYAGLLQEPEGQMCLGCHRSMRKAMLLTPVSAHSAVTGGRCAACHDAHFSDNPALLRQPAGAVCSSCHASLLAPPGGGTWPVTHKPVEEGKCRLCHRTHTSSNPALLKAPPPQSCRPCHVPFFSEVEDRGNASVHGAIREGRCGACHQLHGGAQKLLRDGHQETICRGCHQKLKNTHHFLSVAQIASGSGEGGAAKGCLLCHLPHASTRARLLVPEAACKRCHKI